MTKFSLKQFCQRFVVNISATALAQYDNGNEAEYRTSKMVRRKQNRRSLRNDVQHPTLKLRMELANVDIGEADGVEPLTTLSSRKWDPRRTLPMGTGVRPRSWRSSIGDRIKAQRRGGQETRRQQVAVGDGGKCGIEERVEEDEVDVSAQAALV